MALPLIPIILAVASVASGLVQGVSSAKNAKEEAKAVQQNTQAQINERAKAAKKLMQQQKTSFLKSGIYFDSGTPVDVINETYDTSVEDINAMIKDTIADSVLTYHLRPLYRPTYQWPNALALRRHVPNSLPINEFLNPSNILSKIIYYLCLFVQK